MGELSGRVGSADLVGHSLIVLRYWTLVLLAKSRLVATFIKDALSCRPKLPKTFLRLPKRCDKIFSLPVSPSVHSIPIRDRFASLLYLSIVRRNRNRSAPVSWFNGKWNFERSN